MRVLGSRLENERFIPLIFAQTGGGLLTKLKVTVLFMTNFAHLRDNPLSPEALPSGVFGVINTADLALTTAA